MADEPTPSPLTTLTVGSRVFYPGNGVATVTGTETRTFGDAETVFYVLALDRGVTMLVPEGKVARAALRELTTPAEAKALLKRVTTDPQMVFEKPDAASRKARYAEYSEALRSGAAASYTDVLQELIFRARADKLSTSEGKTFDTALGYFVSEVSAVLERPAEALEADLRSFADE